MFANAPLSDSQVFVSTVIITAAVICPIILIVLGGLGCYQNRAAAKAALHPE
jgi:hypothetical protein